MQEKLSRLEEQMKKLLADFRDACKKSEELLRENERLLNELMEKNRRLEVVEERDSVLMEAQAEKRRLEQKQKNIREETERLLEKVRALTTGGEK